MAEPAFTLTVRQGDHRQTYVFRQPVVVIGRAKEADVRIDDRLVSRRHCRLECDDGRFLLYDEGAQNRPRVRGRPIEGEGPVEVRLDEAFIVGSAELRLGLVEPDRLSAAETFTGEPARDTQTLRAMVDIARALAEQQDLARLLTLIVDSAIQLTGAERGFLILANEGESSIEVARNFAREEVLSPEFKISRTIARQVMDSGMPQLTTNALEDDRFRNLHSVADLKLRSVLCIPIHLSTDGDRDAADGVLYVDNRLQDQVFHEREKDLLLSFADHAAIAIRNARVVEELRRRQADLQAANASIAQLNSALKGQLAAQTAELSEIRAELGSTDRGGRFRYDYKEIVGESRAMHEMFRLLDKYVPTDDPVLILGESGTGKELVARAVWRLGPHGRGPFVTENCAALPETLLESELFGYRKGAFTGANSNKKGLFELASGGVLFLDEIGEMPLDLQAKLLRVLQEGTVRPLGATEEVRVDVRLVTATNRNIDEMVREGDFREDLFYRLNVLPVHVPPLRERRDDIPRLVQRFLLDLSRDRASRVRVSADAMAALTRYRWPGNVRELYNEVRRAALLCDGVVLEAHLSDKVRTPAEAELAEGPVPAERDTTLPDMIRELEEREIKNALQRSAGNKSRTAQMLGLSRFALQRKLEKYQIDVPE